MNEIEAAAIVRVIAMWRAEEGDEESCEALDMAKEALEEIQQYRAIGTVEEIQQKLKELKRWHTSEVNPKIKNVFANTSTLICQNCDHKDEYIEELEAEVAECRAAVEKQTPYKPESYSFFDGKCKCGAIFLDRLMRYCANCGQRLNWEE